MNLIEFGDCRETMRRWACDGVKAKMCVTSPPYFGLRDYGHDGQIGLEQTPEEYIAAMVEVFRCVRDVLEDDGTLWLNIGDSYASFRDGKATPDTTRGDSTGTLVPKGKAANRKSSTFAGTGIKHKDMIGIPWMLAFALRADGWFLRQDIIWHKPNPMPESVRDRCTKAHEFIFLLAKSERYFIDQDGMREPAVSKDWPRDLRPAGWATNEGAHSTIRHQQDGVHRKTRSKAQSFKREGSKREQTIPGQAYGTHRPDRAESTYDTATRNRRSVWTVATRPYKGAHFATFPPALIEPCILAGSRKGDIVLDPFMGSGTTAATALSLGRQYLGCELNPEYGALQEERINAATNLLAEAADDPKMDMFLHAGSGSISEPMTIETKENNHA